MGFLFSPIELLLKSATKAYINSVSDADTLLCKNFDKLRRWRRNFERRGTKMFCRKLKLLTALMSVALSLSYAGVANATDLGYGPGPSAAQAAAPGLSVGDRDGDEIILTESEAANFAMKIAEAGSAFVSSIIQPGNFKIVVTDDELVSRYGFTPGEVGLLHNFMVGTPPTIRIVERSTTAISTRGKFFHISNTDLKAGTFAFLVTAAESGPAAVAAVWPILTSLAGPLGTIAGAITGLLGGAFFADLAVKITGAIAQGKGISFYSKWSWNPIEVRIEAP
ncbi:hypothetical protein ACRQEF_06340 [Actinotignum sp. GS-2025a]|uniref:hypothetical protein n=1 Tax=Actinotignum sp. GS-2025a TaxID=3427274 RepID=UPI003F45B120